MFYSFSSYDYLNHLIGFKSKFLENNARIYWQVHRFLKELAKPTSFTRAWTRLKFCMYLKCTYFNYSKNKFFTMSCTAIKPDEFQYQFRDEDKFIDENIHRILPLCIDTRPQYYNKNKIRELFLKFFSIYGKMKNSPKNVTGKPQVK